jgi:ribosomal protein L19E
LIVLASLPNSWEAVSSSAGKSKLKYEDIRDLIVSEKMHIRDFSEASCSSAALNLETRGKGYGRKSGQGRSRSRKGRSESGFGNQPEC